MFWKFTATTLWLFWQKPDKNMASNSLEFQNNSSSAAISCYLGKIWTENETRQLLKKTFKLPTCIRVYMRTVEAQSGIM